MLVIARFECLNAIITSSSHSLKKDNVLCARLIICYLNKKEKRGKEKKKKKMGIFFYNKLIAKPSVICVTEAMQRSKSGGGGRD